MINSGRADVVGPTVTANDPDTSAKQVICHRPQVFDLLTSHGVELLLQLLHPGALMTQLRFVKLWGLQNRVDGLIAQLAAEFLKPCPGRVGMQISGQPQTQTKFGIVLKQRVRPRRSATVLVR